MALWVGDGQAAVRAAARPFLTGGARWLGRLRNGFEEGPQAPLPRPCHPPLGAPPTLPQPSAHDARFQQRQPAPPPLSSTHGDARASACVGHASECVNKVEKFLPATHASGESPHLTARAVACGRNAVECGSMLECFSPAPHVSKSPNRASAGPQPPSRCRRRSTGAPG